MVVSAPRRSQPVAPRRLNGRRLVVAVAAVPGGMLALLLLIVLLVAGQAAHDRQQCGPSTGALSVGFDGPGSLGGVAGTGLTVAQVQAVRAGSPYAGERIAAGRYESTAYGPPWGGINGPGQATSGGIVLAGGAPRYYLIAVDPAVISHGTLVYAWPNPFGWKGPFLAADTGGAILGGRVDFYDWRGRTMQLRWGRRPIQVSPEPIKPGGPDATTVAAAAPLAGGCGAIAASGPLGTRIGEIARSHLGAGSSIAGFEPPSVSYYWCAWFATNVWRRAGVDIPMSAASFAPYTWAQSRGLLFKRVGQPPRAATPPPGAALMWGTGPESTSSSWHVNLVDQVNPDGSFMVTGGNQDTSRVTRYGPCRLSRTDPAYLTGPGCDTKPIYGIAAPGGETA